MLEAMAEEHYPSDDDQSFTSAHSDFHPHPDPNPEEKQDQPSRRNGDATPDQDEDLQAVTSDARFSPEEEARLLSESNTLKTSANTLFGRGSYGEAIQTYDRALSSCPNYLDYDIAVLQSNISACHVKLLDWKEAITSATKSLDALERIDPLPKPKPVDENGSSNGQNGGPEAQIQEIDDETAEKIEALEKSGKTRDEVQKIRVKAMMRRAKARMETGGWAALQGADEDYRYLSTVPNLSPLDRKTVQSALVHLGPRLNQAKEQEMAEMMGKLKGLGNSILKPFGMSTNNFKFVKDEKTGGYSMNFDQNAK